MRNHQFLTNGDLADGGGLILLTRDLLINPGKIPLTLIEVLSGSYIGEDDIIRIEDKYGRKKN